RDGRERGDEEGDHRGFRSFFSAAASTTSAPRRPTAARSTSSAAHDESFARLSAVGGFSIARSRAAVTDARSYVTASPAPLRSTKSIAGPTPVKTAGTPRAAAA